jgi:hypothetical protein
MLGQRVEIGLIDGVVQRALVLVLVVDESAHGLSQKKEGDPKAALCLQQCLWPDLIPAGLLAHLRPT